MESTASLRYKIDPISCEAKSERGTPVKSQDFDCSSLFYMDEMNGILSVARVIDREQVEVISLGLIVEDYASETGPQIDTTELTIKIEDVNDNNPKFKKPFYRFSVAENSKNGVAIGTVMADDSDKNKTITYSMEGRQDMTKMVYLNKDTGDLVVANKIDHEVYDWLNLTIKASDSGVPARSSRVELFVQILDKNDNRPFFLTDPRILMVPEDTPVGQKIAVLEARDSDSGKASKKEVRSSLLCFLLTRRKQSKQ